jgi:uncharacterized protein
MVEEILVKMIADELNLNTLQVENTIELLDTDNTVPFIARYRKEKTGNLNEEQIREIQERIHYLRNLENRRQTILRSIADQGKLNAALKKKIEQTYKLHELEDLYLPYKLKKQTRAGLARDRGLSSLAQLILAQELVSGDVREIARSFIKPEKKVLTAEEALSGARDILAEIFSENVEIRQFVRTCLFSDGLLRSKLARDEAVKEYEMYFDFSQSVKTIPPHRILAINRGEKDGVLAVDIKIAEGVIHDRLYKEYVTNEHSIFLEQLRLAIADAYKRLIAPGIKREVRSELTRQAEQHAIKVFSLNLRNLLMQPPVPDKIIMGIDPGFRTGCKIAVINGIGKYLEGTVIYPHPPQGEYFTAKSVLRDMIEKYGVEVVAIGNGTASRETEVMMAELIQEIKPERELHFIVVSEAGASVYSASAEAREEFPELEVGLRGNISIARRLQDPLAELVKIDPRSIGVGLYQHDVDQKKLTIALTRVVESCVNQVGIDLNTASAALLRYISGLNSKTAQEIVEYRQQQGPFKNREQLKQVPGIGEKSFQQAAGFLRIRSGDNPLDATSIHPESYVITGKLMAKFSVADIFQEGKILKKKVQKENIDLDSLARELECGLPTLVDMLNDLEKPGRDPREALPKPFFRQDVLKIEDLKAGMTLKGIVRNVVDFGIFVDIGVKQDGLVHISQMTKKYVKSPFDLVQVGNEITVRVLSVDLERNRIALSMME